MSTAIPRLRACVARMPAKQHSHVVMHASRTSVAATGPTAALCLRRAPALRCLHTPTARLTSQPPSRDPDTAAAAAAAASTAFATSPATGEESEDSALPSSPPPPAPLFLRMPPIDGVGRCRLLRWLVPVGSPFSRGAVLAEIDSDLAVIEYKAQDGGVMALHRVGEGEKIVEGQILAVQVREAAAIGTALPWLQHVERMARRERREREQLEEMHEKEEAEAEVIHKLEQEEAQQEEATAVNSAAAALSNEAEQQANSSRSNST